MENQGKAEVDAMLGLTVVRSSEAATLLYHVLLRFALVGSTASSRSPGVCQQGDVGNKVLVESKLY